MPQDTSAKQKVVTAAGTTTFRTGIVLSLCIVISVAALLQHTPSNSPIQIQRCRRSFLPDGALNGTAQPEASRAEGPAFAAAENVPEPETVVAYYQCFNRPKAAEMVLKLWRQAYPRASVYMVNDGGNHKLQEMAKKYTANYTYSTRSSNRSDGLYFADVQTNIAFVQRILDCARHADWVVLLEDDVHVLKPVTIHSLHYDLNGDNPNAHLRPTNVDTINKVRKIPLADSHFGGCGGAVLRGAFLRYMQHKAEWKQNIQLLYDAVKNDQRPTLASDELLSSLIYMDNGTLGGYPGFTEKWYGDYQQRQAEGRIEILHQQKDYYDKDPNV